MAVVADAASAGEAKTEARLWLRHTQPWNGSKCADSSGLLSLFPSLVRGEPAVARTSK
jgi:hypothetical protein